MERRLVSVRDGEGGGSVVVADDFEIAEPGGPVVVEVASTRIAYVIGAVFMSALGLVEELGEWEREQEAGERVAGRDGRPVRWRAGRAAASMPSLGSRCA